MKLFENLRKKYTKEQSSAYEAQRMAEFIAWGPVVFQASRIMLDWGILEILNKAGEEGLTRSEIVERTHRSDYAIKCLLEASLCIGTVLVDTDTDRYTLSKTGWFLLSDDATRANVAFNHDVNYEGMFRLEDALVSGKPEGLKLLGPWPTLYEGLSEFPRKVRESWFGFDHFYSDASFPEALKIVFDGHHVRSLYDVGGNTGKWAMECVKYCKDTEVTVLDLPQQIGMMQENVKSKVELQEICVDEAKRIGGFGINLLDGDAKFPVREGGLDAIWMSQFLDCFSMEEMTSILRRAGEVMTRDTRLFVMETLWDRQKFDTSAFCLTMTSLYFTAMANGNSKMYNTEDMETVIGNAGLQVLQIYDGLGMGHCIMEIGKQ